MAKGEDEVKGVKDYGGINVLVVVELPEKTYVRYTFLLLTIFV